MRSRGSGAAELLLANPAVANLKRGDLGLTPLHVAVDRDDEALAQIVLAAGPDLTVADDVYHSTARGWAKYQGNERMRRLIEAAGGPP